MTLPESVSESESEISKKSCSFIFGLNHCNQHHGSLKHRPISTLCEMMGEMFTFNLGENNLNRINGFYFEVNNMKSNESVGASFVSKDSLYRIKRDHTIQYLDYRYFVCVDKHVCL